MSEIDFSQLYSSRFDELNIDFIVISTMMFSYLAAAHFAGRQLSRFIASTLTVLYSLFLFVPVSSYIITWNLISRLQLEYSLQYPEGWIIPPPAGGLAFYIVFVYSPILLGWLASVSYMHIHIRKRQAS